MRTTSNLLSTLSMLICFFGASAQNPSSAKSYHWTQLDPTSEEGLQRREMIELYTRKQDFPNAMLVAKTAMRLEPQTFYFADRYVRNGYMTEKSAEVVGISDELIKSEFADDLTFIYNAWIHDYIDEWRIAQKNINTGLARLPQKESMLKAVMRISLAHEDYNSFEHYAQAMLDINPNDAETFGYLFEYHLVHGNVDKAILTGEIGLFLNPSSRKNIETKQTLIKLYNKWLVTDDTYTEFTCFSHPVSDLKLIRSLADIIKLQNHWLYNYENAQAQNPLEIHLYDYKLSMLRRCNWVAFWHSIFGVSHFPVEYKEYLDDNQAEIIGVQECRKSISL